MKKIITVLVCLCLTASAAACSLNTEKAEILGSEEVIKAFFDCPHPDDVLKDCGKINFDLRPDFKGLTKKTDKDEENSTVTENWYNSRGKLIYSVYEDFGEDTFDYYTKSLSGKVLTLRYCLNEGETYWVTATTDGYKAHFDEISDNGAEDIYIEVFRPGNDFETVSYWKKDGRWKTDSAVYFCEEGLAQYYGCSDDGSEDYGTEIIAQKAESVELSGISDDLYYVAPLQCSARSCRISYTENESGREWYLTAPFIYQFENEEAAKRFSAEFGQPEYEYSALDGETPEITTGEYTIRVSPDFADSESFAGFVTMEINDDYSIILKLDDNKEITDFDTGYIQFY